jgi:hypothetical protein
MTTTPRPEDPAPKKKYEPPRLDCYGDIAAITRTVSSSGSPDGGHGAHGRTG